MLDGRLGASDGSVWPSRCAVAPPPATATVPPAQTAPGATSRAPLGTPPFTRGQALRTGDPRHLFPPSPAASSGGTLRPAGIGQRGDASRPRCASRTRPAQRRSFRSRIRFQCATGSLPRGPGSPRPCLQERWTNSSGVRCRPGSAGKWPRSPRRASGSGFPALSGR